MPEGVRLLLVHFNKLILQKRCCFGIGICIYMQLNTGDPLELLGWKTAELQNRQA